MVDNTSPSDSSSGEGSNEIPISSSNLITGAGSNTDANWGYLKTLFPTFPIQTSTQHNETDHLANNDQDPATEQQDADEYNVDPDAEDSSFLENEIATNISQEADTSRAASSSPVPEAKNSRALSVVSKTNLPRLPFLPPAATASAHAASQAQYATKESLHLRGGGSEQPDNDPKKPIPYWEKSLPKNPQARILTPVDEKLLPLVNPFLDNLSRRIRSDARAAKKAGGQANEGSEEDEDSDEYDDVDGVDDGSGSEDPDDGVDVEGEVGEGQHYDAVVAAQTSTEAAGDDREALGAEGEAVEENSGEVAGEDEESDGYESDGSEGQSPDDEDYGEGYGEEGQDQDGGGSGSDQDTDERYYSEGSQESDDEDGEENGDEEDEKDQEDKENISESIEEGEDTIDNTGQGDSYYGQDPQDDQVLPELETAEATTSSRSSFGYLPPASTNAPASGAQTPSSDISTGKYPPRGNDSPNSPTSRTDHESAIEEYDQEEAATTQSPQMSSTPENPAESTSISDPINTLSTELTGSPDSTSSGNAVHPTLMPSGEQYSSSSDNSQAPAPVSTPISTMSGNIQAPQQTPNIAPVPIPTIHLPPNYPITRNNEAAQRSIGRRLVDEAARQYNPFPNFGINRSRCSMCIRTNSNATCSGGPPCDACARLGYSAEQCKTGRKGDEGGGKHERPGRKSGKRGGGMGGAETAGRVAA